MDTVDISAISRMLDEALALPAKGREAWFHGLSSQDQRWRETLRHLLAEHDLPPSQGRLAALPVVDLTDSGETECRANDLRGPYRCLRELGRGGMGLVWLAERIDGAHRRQIALKLPRTKVHAWLKECMAEEGLISARLEHAHIAQLYETGEDLQGQPYLAFQYIDGQPINLYCAEHNLSLRDTLKLFLPIISAVSYAHSQRIVHCDIKPSNVLVTKEGSPHLLDFGVAKTIGQFRRSSGNSAGVLATPSYASEEQLRGEPACPAWDVYSMGVLLYELLSTRKPWPGRRGAMMPLSPRGEAPLASSVTPNPRRAHALKGDMDSILAKALQADARQRYLSVEAMGSEIRHLLNSLKVRACPP